MLATIQRVSKASVFIDEKEFSAISKGVVIYKLSEIDKKIKEL